jgi:hypothetical protein
LGPVGASALVTTRPPIADWVPNILALGADRRKRLRLATKRFDPGHRADQVMIQVELPPYRRPHSPLDLVASYIIFRRMFEAFC